MCRCVVLLMSSQLLVVWHGLSVCVCGQPSGRGRRGATQRLAAVKAKSSVSGRRNNATSRTKRWSLCWPSTVKLSLGAVHPCGLSVVVELPSTSGDCTPAGWPCGRRTCIYQLWHVFGVFELNLVHVVAELSRVVAVVRCCSGCWVCRHSLSLWTLYMSQ